MNLNNETANTQQMRQMTKMVIIFQTWRALCVIKYHAYEISLQLDNKLLNFKSYLVFVVQSMLSY